MLKFKRVRIRFDSSQGHIQVEPKGAPQSVSFGGKKIHSAHVALNGFSIGYTDGEGKFKRAAIDIVGPSGDADTEPETNSTDVKFKVRFLLRDDSGDIDDRYDGYVDVLVIADVAE